MKSDVRGVIAMIMHVMRCRINAFLRTSNICFEFEYSFQDITTIFHPSPINSNAINAYGVNDADSTARSIVTNNRIERVRTT